MAQRCILYLNERGLTPLTETPALFPATPEGHASFGSWLTHLPGHHPLYLLADLPGESFQLERLPPVRGKDRHQLLNRRLHSHFPNTPFRDALSLGRETEGRRDERLLLAALTQPEDLDPWLDTIERSAHRLEGIGSLPLLVPLLCRPLGIPDTPHLIAQITPAGLRITCLVHQQLHYSRLLPLDPSARLPMVEERLHEETARIQQHLLKQQLLGRADSTTVMLLWPAPLPADTPQPTAAIRRMPLPGSEAADGQPPGNSLPFIVSLLARQRPPTHFTPPSLQAAQRGRLRIKLIMILGLGIGLGAGLASLPTWQDTHALRLETQKLEARLQKMEGAIAAQPSLPVSRSEAQERMLDSIQQLRRTLEQTRGAPLDALQALGQALARTPDGTARLETLEWAYPLHPLDKTPESTEGAHLTAGFSLPGEPENGRQRLRAYQDLSVALGALPNSRLEILRRPPDLDPRQSLQRELDSPATAGSELHLRIHWNPGK